MRLALWLVLSAGITIGWLLLAVWAFGICIRAVMGARGRLVLHRPGDDDDGR